MGKLLYDEKNGYTYVSNNGVKYDLLEGMSFHGTLTSEIIFIMLHVDSDLYDNLNIVNIDVGQELVYWFYGAYAKQDDKWFLDSIEDEISKYENKHPELVKYYKKKKRIIRPMPAELSQMLHQLSRISSCGEIRTYYDKKQREMAEGGLSDYEYSDSTLVHNLMCCCEEVADALLDEDIDKAEELIKLYYDIKEG